MKGGGNIMEQMKISSILKAYPNSFVLAQKAKVSDSSRRVLLAQVMGVCATKEEAIVQQAIFKMVGVKTFLIPTIEEPESALHIEMSEDEYKAEPLLSPAENAMIFRQYYELD